MSGKVLAETGVFFVRRLSEKRAQGCTVQSRSREAFNMSAFGTVLMHAAWRSKPSWAVIATEDKAFDQAMLIHMAERIHARITKVSASHAVFMTQPKVVADTIDRAAKDAAKAK